METAGCGTYWVQVNKARPQLSPTGCSVDVFLACLRFSTAFHGTSSHCSLAQMQTTFIQKSDFVQYRSWRFLAPPQANISFKKLVRAQKPHNHNSSQPLKAISAPQSHKSNHNKSWPLDQTDQRVNLKPDSDFATEICCHRIWV